MSKAKFQVDVPRRDTPYRGSGELPVVPSERPARRAEEVLDRLERNVPALAEHKRFTSSAIKAAELVRGMRERAELSQTELAKRIGKNPSVISDIERVRGKLGPSFDVLRTIADACEAEIIFHKAEPVAHEEITAPATEVKLPAVDEDAPRKRSTKVWMVRKPFRKRFIKAGVSGKFRTINMPLLYKLLTLLGTRKSGVYRSRASLIKALSEGRISVSHKDGSTVVYEPVEIHRPHQVSGRSKEVSE